MVVMSEIMMLMMKMRTTRMMMIIMAMMIEISPKTETRLQKKRPG